MTGITAVVVTSLLLAVFFGGRLPRRYRDRKCQGAAWRDAFPTVPKEAIRDFLSMFVDAFAIKRTEQLQFAPTDRILDVYRAIYPSRLLADNLELETLADQLEQRFGFRLESIWDEQTTMGDVFTAVRARAAT